MKDTVCWDVTLCSIAKMYVTLCSIAKMYVTLCSIAKMYLFPD